MGRAGNKPGEMSFDFADVARIALEDPFEDFDRMLRQRVNLLLVALESGVEATNFSPPDFRPFQQGLFEYFDAIPSAAENPFFDEALGIIPLYFFGEARDSELYDWTSRALFQTRAFNPLTEKIVLAPVLNSSDRVSHLRIPGSPDSLCGESINSAWAPKYPISSFFSTAHSTCTICQSMATGKSEFVEILNPSLAREAVVPRELDYQLKEQCVARSRKMLLERTKNSERFATPVALGLALQEEVRKSAISWLSSVTAEKLYQLEEKERFERLLSPYLYNGRFDDHYHHLELAIGAAYPEGAHWPAQNELAEGLDRIFNMLESEIGRTNQADTEKRVTAHLIASLWPDVFETYPRLYPEWQRSQTFQEIWESYGYDKSIECLDPEKKLSWQDKSEGDIVFEGEMDYMNYLYENEMREEDDN
jgi:hypothetical protein